MIAAETNDVQSVHVVVSGRVQGVGFRMYIQRHAATLGLTGYCRNMAGGTVFALAYGPHERLCKWLELVRQGPASAHVLSMEEQWNVDLMGALPERFEVRG